jgi:DNA-binding response OmpR family regulator
VVSAKRAGVDSYIVKPFSANTLRSKIEYVFDGSTSRSA